MAIRIWECKKWYKGYVVKTVKTRQNTERNPNFWFEWKNEIEGKTRQNAEDKQAFGFKRKWNSGKNSPKRWK